METITIDDKEIRVEDLSENGKKQLERFMQLNNQMEDHHRQIEELKVLISAYVNAIKKEAEDDDGRSQDGS